MTRRAWIVLVLGLALGAAIGVGFARAGRPSCCDKPQASWGMFTPAEWTTLKDSVARRGFDEASVRIVSATEIANRRPFALLAATASNGKTCVVPVKGTALGATVCDSRKPLLLFTAPDTWRDAAVPGVPAHVVHATAVIGVVQPGVTGVVALDHLGHAQGLPLMPAGHLGAFAGGFADLTGLTVYGAHNHVLARVTLGKS